MSRVGDEPGRKPGDRSTSTFQIDPSEQLGIDYEGYSGKDKQHITEIEGVPCAGLIVKRKPHKKAGKRAVKKTKQK